MPVVKEIQATPNPNALKFVLDGPLLCGPSLDRPLSFRSSTDAAQHPLAKRLFDVAGVTNLFFLGDFITVSKAPDVPWSKIRQKVRTIINRQADLS